MPNWCESRLTVSGATPEFRAWLEAERFSFEAMAPPNDAPNETDSHKLQDARTNAWGTKWDLDDSDQHRVAMDLVSRGSAFFDTAWDPPLAALVSLSRRFTAETFVLDYYEPGNGIAGSATFRNGGCIQSHAKTPEAIRRIGAEVFGWGTTEEQPPA